jgi:peptide/nickel transport system substrate-binding protein
MRTVVLLACAAMGCGVTPTDRAAGGAPIEILVPTEPLTLDPRFATRALDVRITRLAHAGLVTLDPNTLAPIPLLAERLEREGEKVIVVTLRRGPTFHSGRPLTPEDVCATLTALAEPSLGSPHRSIVESFEHCRVRDAQTLSFEMRTPRATWMTDLEVPILRSDEVNGAERAAGNLDGLGSYRITSRTHGTVTLTAARAHTGSGRSLVVRTVADENVRAMRLISGRAEIAPNAFSPTLLSGLLSAETQVRARPGANVSYVLINGDRQPFQTAEARRALSMALDRQSLTKYLFGAYATPAKWLLPEGHWASPRDLPELPYDPTAARKVLSQLDGVTLLTSTERSRVLHARAIAQMLSDAGVSTRVVPLELGLLLSRLDAGQYSLAILQFPELTEPNVLRWFFHPRGIESPTEGRNRARYRSDVAARLLDEASRELDLLRRTALYVDIARVMLEDMPVVPLWHESQVVVTRGRGRPFLPSAEGRWAALESL